MNVFVYGSLQFPKVWRTVVRGNYNGAPALLQGHRRSALRDAEYPGAVPDPGARIAGWVWFDIDADDVARLDAFEGDEYRRDEVVVVVEAGEARVCDAQVYVFLEHPRLAALDWDAAAFERDHLEHFLSRRAPGRD